MSLSAGAHLGPYEVLGPLGAGGMGEVYRARDQRLGREVAVKVLPAEVSQDSRRVARFEGEARALAALSHPNVLEVHDVGRSDGRFYVVTELLEGENLRSRMSEPFPWRKAAEIAGAIADGLAAAHAAGIVHRDLKPENVFLTSDGRLKILDFGLATVAEPVAEDAVTLTSPSGGTLSGEVVGTLSYMAPEQLRGRRVDGRTDLFALGCVLYEMLAGHRPFSGPTPADTLALVLQRDPEPLGAAADGIPRALEVIVYRCLEKRPEDRYDTAHDLALSLKGLSSSAEMPALRPPGPPAPAARLPRKALIASALLLVSAGIVGVTILTSRAMSSRGAQDAPVWGPPRQITSAPGWEGEPALSPDGTLVAYSSDVSGRHEIWVVDTEGGEPLRLTDGGGENHNPVWFPDGRTIAFVSTQGPSSRVRRVSRLGGSTGLVVDNADTPAVSPDGASIAFARETEGGSYRIWVAPIADPSRALRLTGDEDGVADHQSPAWSPDGARICYAALRNLWVVPAAGGKPARLTRDDRHDRDPVFSPDGTWLYFSSWRSDPRSIWRVAATGGSPERVMFGTGTAIHPSFSRDGKRLVFASSVRDLDILLLDRASGSVSRISTSADDESPALAPDGSAVVFVSNRTGPRDLWIQGIRNGRISDTPASRLTSLQMGTATPAFSPDGRWIAFFTITREHRAIWAVPLGGGAAFPLVQDGADNIHPAYAPDMSRLAFVSDRSGHRNIWGVALKGGRLDGEPWPVTTGLNEDLFPAWAPDGRRIAFLRGSDVWVTDARPGAGARAVTRGAGVQSVAFERDGATLLAPGLFGTPTLHLRRVQLATGASEPLEQALSLGDRNASGSVSLSGDGGLIATDITNLKGNIWVTAATRDGR